MKLLIFKINVLTIFRIVDVLYFYPISKYSKYFLHLTFGWECNDTISLSTHSFERTPNLILKLKEYIFEMFPTIYEIKQIFFEVTKAVSLLTNRLVPFILECIFVTFRLFLFTRVRILTNKNRRRNTKQKTKKINVSGDDKFASHGTLKLNANRHRWPIFKRHIVSSVPNDRVAFFPTCICLSRAESSARRMLLHRPRLIERGKSQRRISLSLRISLRHLSLPRSPIPANLNH